MRCKQARKSLSALVDGELTAERSLDVRAHLERCEECASAASQLRRLRRAAQELEDHAPPADLFARSVAALEERQPRWGWLNRTVAAALAGAAAVAVAVWIYGGRPAGTGGTGSRAPSATLPSDRALLAGATREFRRAETHYRRAIAQLRGIAAREQRLWLDRDRQRHQRRLRNIDGAIDRFRRFAQLAPADPSTQELLFSAYRQQILYLRRAILSGATADLARWPPREAPIPAGAPEQL